MSVISFILVAIALAVAAYIFFVSRTNVPAVPVYPNPSVFALSWDFEYSPGMPTKPLAEGAGWDFVFPQAPGSVHCVTTPPASQRLSRAISANVRVETSGEVTFEALNAGEFEPTPAKVRLYFQRRGDTLSGLGEYEFYRWWSVPFDIVPGPIGAIRPLDPSQWISVMGKTGDSSPQAMAGFEAAIGDVGKVGMTFGGMFAGHGVRVSGSGMATFHMDSFEAI